MSNAPTDNTQVQDSPNPEPHRGILVLVLGILSLVLCAPLGIAAWMMGSTDLAAMQAGRMDRTGEGMTRAGHVLGIIGTILFGLGLVWFLIVGSAMFGMAGQMHASINSSKTTGIA